MDLGFFGSFTFYDDDDDPSQFFFYSDSMAFLFEKNKQTNK